MKWIEASLDWEYSHSEPKININLKDGYDSTLGEIIIKYKRCIENIKFC
tara:strand:+ start:4456 stop:4602 length:147 start_codon:yes stop_codon:yes gene_type:complete